MAKGQGYIDQVVSKAALQQVVDLTAKLSKTDAELKKVSATIVDLNGKLSGGASFKETNQITAELQKQLLTLDSSAKGYMSTMQQLSTLSGNNAKVSYQQAQAME